MCSSAAIRATIQTRAGFPVREIGTVVTRGVSHASAVPVSLWLRLTLRCGTAAEWCALQPAIGRQRVSTAVPLRPIVGFTRICPIRVPLLAAVTIPDIVPGGIEHRRHGAAAHRLVGRGVDSRAHFRYPGTAARRII